MKALLYQTN